MSALKHVITSGPYEGQEARWYKVVYRNSVEMAFDDRIDNPEGLIGHPRFRWLYPIGSKILLMDKQLKNGCNMYRQCLNAIVPITDSHDLDGCSEPVSSEVGRDISLVRIEADRAKAQSSADEDRANSFLNDLTESLSALKRSGKEIPEELVSLLGVVAANSKEPSVNNPDPSKDSVKKTKIT